MCGIFGAVGKIEKSRWMALAMYNASRGLHSAGIAYHSNALRIEKIAQHPFRAFNGMLSKGIDRGIEGGVLFGHTRWATMGEINNDNAHPWFTQDKEFVYAHNGHITNHKTFGSYEVDSQSLGTGISEKDFSKYQGKIGLCWIDQQKNLFLYKHDQELSMAIKKDVVYFSSDGDHLKAIGLVPQELQENYIYRMRHGRVLGKEKVPSPTRSIEYSPTFWQTRSVSGHLDSFERVDNFEQENDPKWIFPREVK